MISIYFGERRSKVDTNIIECRKSKLWACKACYSLDMSKDFNIVKCDYTKGYDKLYSHIEIHHKDFRNLLHHKRHTTIQITFGNNISNKAKNIYGHLDNLTSNNLSVNLNSIKGLLKY